MSEDNIDRNARFDAIVVGAGFAGLCTLHRFRQMGLSTRIYEMGTDVGGTWYWNRYPGARCDAESLAYSFSFSPELEQEWEWSERYAPQPEILKYAIHVSERFDLRRDIRFNRKVKTAHFNQGMGVWRVTTAAGDSAVAPLLIMATGCLSKPMVPAIQGVDSFAGKRYQASLWPHEPVAFHGERVGIIGTGSSAVQAIPVIASTAEHLTVFQRTPNFSVPAVNGPLDPGFVDAFKENYRDHRDFHKRGLTSGFGDLEIKPRERTPAAMTAAELSDEALAAACEQYWQTGGARFMGVVGDALINKDANQRVAEFIHRKIRATVKDPQTAEDLCPTSHPVGTKRICVDIGYYETFNQLHVRLVNINRSPIERITAKGVQLRGEHVELDTLILATGFDAMTGALNDIDIRGTNGQQLKEKWAEGPRTYLGLMIAGFPNLFTITGPGSPSVLSNMLVSIEQHVDFICSCLQHMSRKGFKQVQTGLDHEDAWVAHVNEVAHATLFPKAGSWYMGANIPGKPRVFMPYAGGVGPYRELCDSVAKDNWRGFVFS
ncbi:MAG: NAD(P)/FAD-dependent oxidoreductase [Gammaproteobacteria bacterium]|nr:NAD(P)/FAD-dependent oxidoreductase [Gammaproteobacteria bacterium]